MKTIWLSPRSVMPSSNSGKCWSESFRWQLARTSHHLRLFKSNGISDNSCSKSTWATLWKSPSQDHIVVRLWLSLVPPQANGTNTSVPTVGKWEDHSWGQHEGLPHARPKTFGLPQTAKPQIGRGVQVHRNSHAMRSGGQSLRHGQSVETSHAITNRGIRWRYQIRGQHQSQIEIN